MDNKKEPKLIILVTLVVLFISLLSPPLAAVILLGIIIAFAIYKSKLPKDKI